MTDYSALMEKAKWDKLSQKEFDLVVSEIQKCSDSEENLFEMIYILGHSDRREAELYIRPFLLSDDPMIVQISIRALCKYLSLYEMYFDELKKWLCQPDDSFNMYIKYTCISMLDEYIFSYKKGWIKPPEPKLLEKATEIVNTALFKTTDPDVLRLLNSAKKQLES